MTCWVGQALQNPPNKLLKKVVTCGALRDLIPFVQFKKHEKHSVSFHAQACHFTKINTSPWVFFTCFKLYK